MSTLQCRLCSSQASLISLFSGKSRDTRDYIRKLVAETTGIKFQKNDIINCICLNCVLHVYNFYIFRTRALQNVKKLKIISKIYDREPPRKILILDLDDINLPDIDKLKETLAPWLQSKQACIINQEKENEKKQTPSIISQNKQSVTTLVNDKNVQTCISVLNQSTQTLTTKRNCDSVRIQTCLETCNKDVQCNILDKIRQTKRTKDNGIQTYLETIDQTPQSNETIVIYDKYCTQAKSRDGLTSFKCEVNIQNCVDRLKGKTESQKKERFLQNIDLINTQTCNEINKMGQEPQYVHRSFQMRDVETQYETDICESVQKINKKRNIIMDNDQSLQKNRIDTVEKMIQCELIKKDCGDVKMINKKVQCNERIIFNNQEDRRPTIQDKEIGIQTENPTAENSTQTESFNKITDMLESNSRINVDFKKEMISPILSPTKSLNISASSNDINFSENFISQNMKSSSPISNNLLTVRDVVQYVKLCKECDCIMYSKTEAQKHKKTHMRCFLCKKAFPSIKKAKNHIEFECDAKITKMKAIVNVDRLNQSKHFNSLKLSEQSKPKNSQKVSESLTELVIPFKRIKLPSALTSDN